VDENGSVELTDGACLYGVDVIPTAICRELTDIQKQIVYLTNACIGAEDTCYRGLPDGLLPGWRSLDFSALYGLKLPSLEAIALPIAATPARAGTNASGAVGL